MNCSNSKIGKALLGLAYALTFLVLAFVTISLFVQADSGGAGSQESAPRQSAPVYYQLPDIPDTLTFCGERVPLENFDVRESLESELLKIMYWHSSTILYLKRASRYFPPMRRILKENGVPDDFIYLCVCESGMDNAVSPAKAVGFWQLLESTGKEGGLEINSEVDERYNIEKETEAACKYLKEAYRKYGDWMTVAASYNAGQGGISSRLESQHQSRAMDLWLVTETSRYMFRILVAKMFFADPESFGFHVDKSETYRYFPPKEVVTVSEPIPSLVDFAEEHGVSYAQLKRVNLWLRDSKLTNKDRKTYRIVIPQDK